ncbi:MAG: asparagine synthase C-terminal domain-containing protein, partial [Candidatus Eisenbacteria bacterium]
DPVADPAAINAYLICEAARATSSVLLSGTGADELFGGYQKYTATQLGSTYQRIAKPVRKWLLEPVADSLPVAIGRVGLRPFRRVKRFLRHAGLDSFDRFLGFSCYYDADELGLLLNGDPKGATDPYKGVQLLKEAWDRRGTDDLVDRMTYVDLKYYLPGLALAYMDRASMAASVEVRVPLLDDVLVDFMARLPGVYKADGWRTKILLREAVRGLVPNGILNRPKAPFAAPVRSWLRRDMAPLIDEYLGAERIKDRGLLNQDVVCRLVHEHRQGAEDHSLRLWALLTLEVWCQEFIDKASQFKEPLDSIELSATTTAGALK